MYVWSTTEARSRNHSYRHNAKKVLRISSVCLCSVSYPACNSHAPDNVVNFGLSGNTIFFSPHYLINGTIFGKNFQHTMCASIFSKTFVRNIFHSKKNLWRHYQKCSRSQCPRGLRRGSATARLLRLWVRIPPAAWMSVVSVVCYQVEVSASSWSLVQRSSTDCGASLCVI
jgi:hypothetical protein